MGRRG